MRAFLLFLSLCPCGFAIDSQFDPLEQVYHVKMPPAPFNDNTLQLAREFENSLNYAEAITEYKRFLYHHPNKPGRRLVEWQIAHLYFQSKNYKKASQVINAARAEKPVGDRFDYFLGSLDLDIAARKNMLTWQQIKKFRSLNRLQPFEEEHLRFSTASYFLSQGRERSARLLLRDKFSFSKLEQKRQKAVNHLEQAVDPLSYFNLGWAVFPGGTFFRLGEYRRAALSFFTVSLLAAAGVAAIKGGLVITGMVAAFFAFRFYLVSFSESFKMLSRYNQGLYQGRRQAALQSLASAGFSSHIHVSF